MNSKLKVLSRNDFFHFRTQLNFIVAIDYTGSNGDPRDPKSLHYFDPGLDSKSRPNVLKLYCDFDPTIVHQNNQYTNAIRAVGDIVQEYDSDKQFPAYGFGAKLPNGQVDFCFNVNLTPNPDCNMIDGVLYAYRRHGSQVGSLPMSLVATRYSNDKLILVKHSSTITALGTYKLFTNHKTGSIACTIETRW